MSSRASAHSEVAKVAEVSFPGTPRLGTIITTPPLGQGGAAELLSPRACLHRGHAALDCAASALAHVLPHSPGPRWFDALGAFSLALKRPLETFP